MDDAHLRGLAYAETSENAYMLALANRRCAFCVEFSDKNLQILSYL